MKPITELIRKRRSVRTYNGESLPTAVAEEIRNYIGTLKAPFGAEVRIELIHGTAEDGKPVKLGTYGWVSGAKDYLLLIYKDSPLVEEAAAYVFEQVLLYCTGLDLGTCWLGGSFSRSDFKKQVQLADDERLRIVSPVGYALPKKRLIERLMGADNNHASRKAFEEVFFYGTFDTPLTEEAAGKWQLPLEMVRLAPSANNKQPWRILYDGSNLHFYRGSSYGFSSIDTGIALCHFEQTCKEKGLAGHFEVLTSPLPHPNASYAISWVPEE